MVLHRGKNVLACRSAAHLVCSVTCLDGGFFCGILNLAISIRPEQLIYCFVLPGLFHLQCRTFFLSPHCIYRVSLSLGR